MTAPIGPASQYATAKPFYEKANKSDGNLVGSPEDAERLKAYALYEDFYYNRPENFKVFVRSDDEDSMQIYIPSAKKIIEAMNRFLCKDYGYVVSGDNRAEAQLRLDNLFKREKIMSKFSTSKRMGLIRGDACFFLTADPTKPEWAKISVNELNPANLFTINDPTDRSRVLGYYIVEVVRDPREKEDRTKVVARRRSYIKAGVTFNQSTGQYEQAVTTDTGVFTDVTHWEIGKWDDRNLKKDDLEKVTSPLDVAPFKLPDQITSLPVYHWKNTRMGEKEFGLSELSGIESLIAAINQSMTDEDMTLVLQGLGVYATDSKPPVNADGTAAPWTLGPGVVVEHSQGTSFDRVSGVPTVAPYLEHMQEMKNAIQEANGIPDIAAGKVDVTVAESGISLSLQLLPILASAKEKEEEIVGVMDHMLYDILFQWFPAFESANFEGVDVRSTVGSAMPVNREARIQEIMLLFTSQLITIGMAQGALAEFGYNFVQGDDEKILREQAALAAARNGDDQANRYAQELEAKETTLNPGAAQAPALADQLGGAAAPAAPTVTV